MGATAAGFSSSRFLATSVLPSRAGSTQPRIWPPGQQRHREVAALALLLGHVRLEEVVVAEHPPRPLPIPDERVERGEQGRAVGAASAARQPRQRHRVGPRGERLLGAGYRDRGEAGRLGRLVEGGSAADVQALPVQPLVLDQVGVSGHPERAGGHPDQVGQAFRVGRLTVEQRPGDGALGQIVDAPPADAAHADGPAGVEQPLGRDLHLRPVPPRSARLRAAELGRGQRPLLAQPRENLVAGPLADLVPALAPGGDGPSPPGVVGPVLDRQDAGGVRPVLERLRPAGRQRAGAVRPRPRPRPVRSARPARRRRARATARGPRSCRAGPPRSAAAPRSRRRAARRRRENPENRGLAAGPRPRSAKSRPRAGL